MFETANWKQSTNHETTKTCILRKRAEQRNHSHSWASWATSELSVFVRDANTECVIWSENEITNMEK